MWKIARRRLKSGRAAPKVVVPLRSRRTKWCAAGRERESIGWRGKKRERQSQCSSWTEQMHLEPLNIGHTSLLTVLSNEPASCRIPCIMCAAFHGLLRLSQEKTGIPLSVMGEQSYNHAQGRSQGWNVVRKPSLCCNYFKCSNHSDNCSVENDNVWVV